MVIELLHYMLGMITLLPYFNDNNNNLNNKKYSSFRYLMDLVTKIGIDLKLGIVQTAYANGGSTDYIQQVLVS